MPFNTPGRPVGIVIGVQLVRSIVIVPVVIIVGIIPIFWAFIVPTRLPVGIVVGIHLIGPVVVVSATSWHDCSPPKCLAVE